MEGIGGIEGEFRNQRRARSGAGRAQAGARPRPICNGCVLPRGTYSGEGGQTHSFAFDREGKILATAGWIGADNDFEAWKAGTPRGDLRLWETANGAESVPFEEECGAIFDVAFSPNGKALATAGRVLGSPDRGEVRIWDVILRKSLITIRVHQGWALAVAYSPDGKFLASGSFDCTVRIWDARTGQEVQVLPHPSTPSLLSFSADGKTFVAGCRGGTVLLWNVATWKEWASFESEKLYLSSAAMSPDGRFLAAGGLLIRADGTIHGHSDGLLRIWDVATGEERHAWHTNGHSTNVAFSPDGRFLATASHESLVWDVETGDEVAVIRRRSVSSSSDRICFSPDGKSLAIGDPRGVQFWDASALQAAKGKPD